MAGWTAASSAAILTTAGEPPAVRPASRWRYETLRSLLRRPIRRWRLGRLRLWLRYRRRHIRRWSRSRCDRHGLAGALIGVVLLHLHVVVARFLAEDVVDFPSLQRLALEELAGDAVESRLVVRDDLFGLVIGLVEDALHFAVDIDGRGLGEILMLRELAAEEYGLFLLAERDRTELGHAPFADHPAGHGRGALDVVAGAG